MRTCFCWLCILSAILALSFFSSQSHAQTSPFKTKTLANGLEVIVVENRMVPLATVELVAKNGGFTEPPEYSGLSHLYEHMFFKANETYRSQAAFLQAMADLGAGLSSGSNASTSQEFVNYFIIAPKSSLDGSMDFMSKAIRAPLFDTAELRKERYVVLGEFDRNEASPLFKLRYAMDSAVWSPALFSRKEQLGLRPTILSATPELMHTIQHRFYVPNNMALVVAGDVNAPEVFRDAEKYFGPLVWKRGADPFPTYDPPPFPPITKQLVVRDAPNLPYSAINVVWHGPSVGKDNASTYAADVFSTILNQPNSRFQKDLVDARLAYQAGVNYGTLKNVGPIEINLFAPIPATKQAIKTMFAEIANWNAQDYFTDDEMATAKRIIAGDRTYEQESAVQFATRSVPYAWASTTLDYYDNYIKNVSNVTRADIQRYLDTYIKGKNYVLGVATNQAALNKLALTPEEVLQ